MNDVGFLTAADRGIRSAKASVCHSVPPEFLQEFFGDCCSQKCLILQRFFSKIAIQFAVLYVFLLW